MLIFTSAVTPSADESTPWEHKRVNARQNTNNEWTSMSILLVAVKGAPLVAQITPYRTLLHGEPQGLCVGQIAMHTAPHNSTWRGRKTPFGATFVFLIVVS